MKNYRKSGYRFEETLKLTKKIDSNPLNKIIRFNLKMPISQLHEYIFGLTSQNRNSITYINIFFEDMTYPLRHAYGRWILFTSEKNKQKKQLKVL